GSKPDRSDHRVVPIENRSSHKIAANRDSPPSAPPHPRRSGYTSALARVSRPSASPAWPDDPLRCNTPQKLLQSPPRGFGRLTFSTDVPGRDAPGVCASTTVI